MPTAEHVLIADTVPPDLNAAGSSPRSLAFAFQQAAMHRADGVAVRSAEGDLTFAELQARAQRIAAGLIEKGVRRGDLVAIYLPRGLDMVAAMLGVCWAGAAYLPLDLTFPAARVQETLTDAQPVLTLTDTSERIALTSESTQSFMLQDIECSASYVEPAGEPTDLAYVIYTSGSTGKPKGVMVSQQNVLRLLSQTKAWFTFNEHDVWTMFHSFAFDFSVWEIWGALLTGGTLVIVPYETSRKPDDFLALLSRERVTVLNQTPTAFGLLCASVERSALPLYLRYVIFGGEALNLRSLRGWVRRFGDYEAQLINMYGITETTVHVTYRRVLAADVDHEIESVIGVPIPDLQVYLLDENGQPVPQGEVGEMYVGGDGVALGYLHRPELTAERFVRTERYDVSGGGRLYRSGDLAKRRSDGELVYLGRADRQVKINGFRVEPGEIEAAVLQFPAVQQVCVAPVQAAGGALLLAAYFVASERVRTTDLSASLAALLPSHMRPTYFVQLASLPLTANGKVDRGALPSPLIPGNAAGQNSDGKPLARVIADVWAGLLQTQDVRPEDNFFDAGGTSLQLLALRTALQARLQREIPVLWLFEHTSPAALAQKLSSAPTESQPVQAQTAADKQRQSFARARAFRSKQS